jgi:hypothetical protein
VSVKILKITKGPAVSPLPGPYKISHWNDGEYIEYGDYFMRRASISGPYVGGRRELCVVERPLGVDGVMFDHHAIETDAEFEATLRLFAAAPDLLEQLAELAIYADSCGRCSCGKGAELHKKAAALIAQVRGLS